MKIFKSVRFKLTFIALLTVFVITALISWSDILDTENRLIAAQKGKAILLSDVIKKSIMLLMIDNRWHELQKLIESFAGNDPELKEVRVFDPVTGRIIVSSAKEEVGSQIHGKGWDKFVQHDEMPSVIKKDNRVFVTRVTAVENTPACFRCHPSTKKILGALDLEISLTTVDQLVAESKYRHISRLALGLLFIVIAFLIGGKRLIREPLTELTAVMKNVESGDLSARARDDTGDEFGYLRGAFNRMIEALGLARKEIESCHLHQMEKTAKLASLGELISGIAHEIKNPLAGISLGIQVLHASLRDEDDRRAFTAEMLNHINRLDKIVKDVLNYARPKRPQYVSSNVRTVLEKALFLVYFDAKKQHVSISSEVEKDVSDIMIDPDQMQLVFLNLILNALQAMPDAGTLKISVAQKEVSEMGRDLDRRPEGAKVVTIRFQDTGWGIAPEDLGHIFEPFFTRKAKGTGLGLSISQKMIQEHGGDIAVHSEVGKGSVFTVYLPVTPAAALLDSDSNLETVK